MTDPRWNPRTNRLAGRRVAICTVTPSAPAAPAEAGAAHRSSAVLETEETVVSFLRAMLAEGATVTLIADEPLALLAGVVAGEYADANVKIIVVGKQRTATDVLAPLHLFIRRVDTFRRAADSIADVRAVLLAGKFVRDDIAAVRERAPAASLFAIAASGVDRWTADGHVRFLDDIARREFSLVAAGGQEEGAEYEYPPIAFAAQWLVRFLTEDAQAVALPAREPSPSVAGGPQFVSAEAAMWVDWEEIIPRLMGYEQDCVKPVRRRLGPFEPGQFVRRAVEDAMRGFVDVTGAETLFRTLAKRVSHLVHNQLE
jgi:hypothetical protein